MKVTRESMDKMLQMCKTLLPMMGVKTTYRPESLDDLERGIKGMFPNGHQPMPTTIIPPAIYLGETIVRNIPGAKWNLDQEIEYIQDLTVTIPGLYQEGEKIEGEVRPFSRIMNFWDDDSYGLRLFYDMIESVSKNNFDVSEKVDKGWQSVDGKVQYRVVSYDKWKEEN